LNAPASGIAENNNPAFGYAILRTLILELNVVVIFLLQGRILIPAGFVFKIHIQRISAPENNRAGLQSINRTPRLTVLAEDAISCKPRLALPLEKQR